VKREAVRRAEQFRFSGHAGMSELHNYLRQLETAAKMFTTHGEEKAVKPSPSSRRMRWLRRPATNILSCDGD